ncbi:lysophospholipid acyltransferase family protein [Micromonospora sp. WMMD1120]|uniref:lysophospholipid acyltransferase family protein n=1 Tax=Micromonospora sp. WMMD1120 TaxID=3016106 RepID=UPI002415E1C4|nr:lysophospholipid acyltransferase family protein [Micromonospora sp. WMMD1120]MDG4805382.1 lysophospholipid acyltransferase family protein [Micromonospora sp. WMMD1120]
MPLLYDLTKLTVGGALRWGWRPRVEGLEHLPRQGGAILAGNHLSVADEMFLASVTPRHVTFWAKVEYFTGRGPGGWLSRRIVAGMGAIPVDRAGGRAAVRALDAAIPVLRAGGLVAIYPEGTRSPDGRLYRGRTGMTRLARDAGVPIVPVGVLGTAEVLPVGARLPRRHPVTLRFGPPIPVADRITGPRDIRTVTDEVMAAIQKLTDQEYVPHHAPPRGS